jgi:hypothetical protein
MGPVHLSDDLLFHVPSGDHVLIVIPLEDIQSVWIEEAEQSTAQAHPAIFAEGGREIVLGSAKSRSLSGLYRFVIHPTPPHTAQRWAAEIRHWADREDES